MQFAQNSIVLGADAVCGIRGVLRGADIHAYEAAVKGSWDAAFVQLSGGHLNASIDFLAGDRFVLYREGWSQRLHTTGVLRPGTIALGIPARSGGEALWWGSALLPGWIPFARSPRELELVTQPGENITVLLADEAHFDQTFERLSGLDSNRVFRNGQALVTAPESVARLLARWNDVIAASAGRERFPVGLPELIDAMLDELRIPDRVHLSGSLKAGVYRKVLHEASRSNFATSVPEICTRLRISRRAVEYAFKENLGLPPHTYFTLRRLDLCKHALEEAEPTRASVTTIAVLHGFHELGRFAGIYRRQFGELPSESLRRVRCSVPGGIALR
jgi:AraC family ethanolamine operon transcriptional activator